MASYSAPKGGRTPSPATSGPTQAEASGGTVGAASFPSRSSRRSLNRATSRGAKRR